MLPNNIELRIKELKRGFIEMEEALLPRLLDKDKNVKHFHFWKDKAMARLEVFVDDNCQGLNLDMLKKLMDKLITS